MVNSISRLEKLEKLDDSYPRDFPGRENIGNIILEHKVASDLNINDNLISAAIHRIAGRISARRDHGENIFFDIFDQTGLIQLLAKEQPAESKKNPDAIPGQAGDAIEACDIGDMVGVEGTIGQNPRGEPLLLISNFITLAKALKDPPANFHGVKNPELKYRHREQDLLSSAETRELFKTRAQIVFEIRKYLNERDFIEIEAPILQPIYGGATAKPFVTHHNALSQDFFLSISSELYLKRSLVGGFDRVYSFSRCFRNEGISPTHNPEFTNLEIFESCKTAQDMEAFTNHIIHLLWEKFTPLDSQPFIHIFNNSMPSSDWPLSRKDNVSHNAEAWEMYINDIEIASGASDLNDPREQEARLKESENNAKLTSPGNEKPDYDPYDQNYIEALEMGALPWAGVGIGIDRLVMLLAGHTNIRDVILFPTLKSLPN